MLVLRFEQHRIGELADIEPFDVATYIEELQTLAAKPTVKQHLAAIRMLFDWLIIGRVLAVNPAEAVRGPKHVVRTGKTPVLTEDQARRPIAGLDSSTLVGLRDRALISAMTYTFCAHQRRRRHACRGLLCQRQALSTRKAASAVCHEHTDRVEEVWSCMRDEGRPLEVGSQVQA